MQPLLAKEADSSRLQDLGKASLSIVHDLKNQLNGLKLYATFLRKRMERDDRPEDECETITKLIAGLDRAAADLTALVRYAKPSELRRQQDVDLAKIVARAIDENSAGADAKPSGDQTLDERSRETFLGDFDQLALTEAFRTLIHWATSVPPSQPKPALEFSIRKQQSSEEVLVEFRNFNPMRKGDPFLALDSIASVRMALASGIIEAHGGTVEHNADSFRVVLPLKLSPGKSSGDNQ